MSDPNDDIIERARWLIIISGALLIASIVLAFHCFCSSRVVPETVRPITLPHISEPVQKPAPYPVKEYHPPGGKETRVPPWEDGVRP